MKNLTKFFFASQFPKMGENIVDAELICVVTHLSANPVRCLVASLMHTIPLAQSQAMTTE